ncbi:glutathione-independent formaldehyde dehydrogenase [Mycobacterium shigaense]|uniref:Glutathione-independent formaldehyde dehydrogenase n=1 Tax=Mycobacterium shigaense TaxID=722731 RepID=A0A1Z4EFD7_9MYCO|nr:glutathione-independent formaldehyde dehydrogenase [Mycobacterium shigaense]MEA1122215.1 glutathione-independent formaldehyde dehydrogenase [Mycobacterium shigaense]PRI16397.1 aldehyde dehydrogenase [Mycobacterium shigaense]BAX91659.1 glutathione-independent formaldehyde dehydrogenase [Mycobacterium shigaense]
MRAVVYNGERDVSIEDVPDPFIERPTDVIVKITASTICGPDLHMYEGRTDLKPGTVMGHENLGEVVEVGPAVRKLRPGDRVCLPINVSCGFCKNCADGATGFCRTVNPPAAGGTYGYPNMGPYSGGQAEYLRVPFADFNALKLPEDSVDKENDYVMLAAVFPTGWHGTQLAQMEPGDRVAVYGAGPIGIMAAYSSLIQGATQVFVIDYNTERLALAEKFGAIGIDAGRIDAVEHIKDLTGGEGVDRGVEAVGYRALDPSGSEQSSLTINALIDVVRPTGGIGVVGSFIPQDPGVADELAKQGRVVFDFGTFFLKGQTMAAGQADVRTYSRYLRDLIHENKATPSRLVSHNLGLAEAPDAYRHCGNRDPAWTTVVLNPDRG